MTRTITIQASPALADLLRGRRSAGRIIGDVATLVRGGDGWSSLDTKLPDYDSRGIIVAVNGGVEGQPANPSELSYDVRAIDASYLDVLTGLVPRFRAVYADEVQVYPAPVGSPCWLHRFPTADGDRWLLRVVEAICFGDCVPVGSRGDARASRMSVEAAT